MYCDLASSTYFSVTMTAKNALDLQGLIAKDYSKKFLFVFSWNAGRVVRIMNDCKECAMDYGRPMKRFFIKISNIWALADKLGGI